MASLLDLCKYHTFHYLNTDLNICKNRQKLSCNCIKHIVLLCFLNIMKLCSRQESNKSFVSFVFFINYIRTLFWIECSHKISNESLFYHFIRHSYRNETLIASSYCVEVSHVRNALIEFHNILQPFQRHIIIINVQFNINVIMYSYVTIIKKKLATNIKSECKRSNKTFTYWICVLIMGY